MSAHPIALVMIVRNESRCLARCLRSVADHVDEVVVLDTGSTDDTVAIARRLGARVGHFAWVDDFAAARNRALQLATAPWRLVLDADEWLVSGGEVLAALRAEPPQHLGLVSVVSHMSDARGQVLHAPSWLPRLLPQGAHYEGRIHEQPVAPLPRRRHALTLAHDGYLPQQMQHKQGRNRRLLQTALAEQPDDLYLAYQLGKDFEVHGDFAQALPLYQRAHGGVAAQASWRHDLVLRLLFTLKSLRRFDEAIALAAAEQPRWSHSPDFFFTLGDLLLDAAMAQPARAGEWLPQIEAAWRRAVDIGEQPGLADTVQGRGSHLAAHNLAVFHASLGQADEAAVWRARADQWRRDAAG